VKQLAEKIGPEFEAVFGGNDMKPNQASEEMHKASMLLNGAGDHTKAD